MRPGTKIVSIAAVPEPQTAIKDLGGRRALSAAFWIMSYSTRSRARRAGISYRYLFMHPSGRDLAQLSELIEQEKLKVTADKTYPFARISEALAYIESGRAKGKVVVRMSWTACLALADELARWLASDMRILGTRPLARALRCQQMGTFRTS